MNGAASGTVLLAALLAAGCGSRDATGTSTVAPNTAISSPTILPSTCRDAPAELVAAVDVGITVEGGGSLTGAKVVVTVPPDQRSTTGWPNTILAANVAARNGRAPKALGSWAVGAAPDYRPIIALNSAARALTSWGTAAAPASMAAANRDHLAGLDATQAAEKCASD